MRKATMLATALIAVLALSVGAFAYPVVVGTHPLSTAHAATPATVTHPKTGDDNSTGNQTNENETGDSQGNETGDHQGNQTGDNQGNEPGDQDNETNDNETAPTPPAPEANETENDTGMFMSNVTVDHNVTVSQVDNTTFVNGTIMVSQNGTALVTVMFQIVAQDNGSANATINVTQMAGSETVTVHGFAVFSPEDHAVSVFGVAKATTNGSIVWERFFAFEAPSSSGCSGS